MRVSLYIYIYIYIYVINIKWSSFNSTEHDKRAGHSNVLTFFTNVVLSLLKWLPSKISRPLFISLILTGRPRFLDLCHI